MQKDGEEWGYINTKGEFAISPRFPSHPNGYVSSFSEGLAAVEIRGKVGYIDTTGTFVIALQFLEGASFHDGLARVVVEGPCDYNHEEAICPDIGVLPRNTLVKDPPPRCTYTFIDRLGHTISAERFEYALNFAEGLAPVRVGKSWGYIDKKGQMVISPQYETAVPFSDGLALVSRNGRYGYIDSKGGYVIEPQYKYAESFAEGVAVVGWPDWGYWYINHSGQQAFPQKFVDASPFFRGLADVKLFTNSPKDRQWHTGTYAYIDRSGKVVFKYEQ